LSQHGSVVRMSGLYTHNRGPHTYWMQQAAKQETIATNAKGYINLIHYEDAAELCLAVLAAGEYLLLLVFTVIVMISLA